MGIWGGAAAPALPWKLRASRTESDRVRAGPTESNQIQVGGESEIDFAGGFGILGEDDVRCFRKGKRRSATQPAGLPFRFLTFTILKKIIRVAISAAVCLTSGVVLAGSHKVRVNDPAAAKALAAQGGKVIGEYGAFTALEADDALLTGVNSNGVEISDDWNLIRLNARELNTTAPEVKSLRKAHSGFTGRQLHLVQFAGPVKAEWLEALKRSGAQVVSYIPENAYLIYGDAPSLARMQGWAVTSEFVQWEGDYTHDLKVHPDARVATDQGRAGVRSVVIQLIADSGSNPATLALIDGLAQGKRMDLSAIAPYRNIVVSLPADQLDTIAAQPDVVSIQPYVQPKKRDERQDQIIAGNLNGNLPSWTGLSGVAGQQRIYAGAIRRTPDLWWMWPIAELTMARHRRGILACISRGIRRNQPRGLRASRRHFEFGRHAGGVRWPRHAQRAHRRELRWFHRFSTSGLGGITATAWAFARSCRIGSSVIFDNSSSGQRFYHPGLHEDGFGCLCGWRA